MRRQSSPQNVHSRNRRQIEIDQHDVELPTLEQIERFVASSAGRDRVSVNLQDARTALAERPIIIDQEDLKSGPGLSGPPTVSRNLLSELAPAVAPPPPTPSDGWAEPGNPDVRAPIASTSPKTPRPTTH